MARAHVKDLCLNEIVLLEYIHHMLDAFSYLLCSKLCQHNWQVPTHDRRCPGIMVAVSKHI